MLVHTLVDLPYPKVHVYTMRTIYILQEDQSFCILISSDCYKLKFLELDKRMNSHIE